jgi:hypothetical protein
MQRSQMARLQFFDCLCNSRQKMVARPRPRNGAPWLLLPLLAV